MSYKINWYIDQQVLLTRHWGISTKADVIDCLQETVALINGSSHPLVHIISDVSELEKPIPFLETLSIMRQQDMPTKHGCLIIVGEKNRIIKFVVNGASGISTQQIHSTETVKEAIAYLKEVDPSIQ